jgi:hypothetical protein
MPFVVQQRAAKWPFGAFATSDRELLLRELLQPLGIRFDDLGHFDGTDELALAVEDFDFHWVVLGILPRQTVFKVWEADLRGCTTGP